MQAWPSHCITYSESARPPRHPTQLLTPLGLLCVPIRPVIANHLLWSSLATDWHQTFSASPGHKKTMLTGEEVVAQLLASTRDWQKRRRKRCDHQRQRCEDENEWGRRKGPVMVAAGIIRCLTKTLMLQHCNHSFYLPVVTFYFPFKTHHSPLTTHHAPITKDQAGSRERLGDGWRQVGNFLVVKVIVLSLIKIGILLHYLDQLNHTGVFIRQMCKTWITVTLIYAYALRVIVVLI